MWVKWALGGSLELRTVRDLPRPGADSVAVAAGAPFHASAARIWPWAIGVAVTAPSTVGTSIFTARSDQHQRTSANGRILKRRASS